MAQDDPLTPKQSKKEIRIQTHPHGKQHSSADWHLKSSFLLSRLLTMRTKYLLKGVTTAMPWARDANNPRKRINLYNWKIAFLCILWYYNLFNMNIFWYVWILHSYSKSMNGTYTQHTSIPCIATISAKYAILGVNKMAWQYLTISAKWLPYLVWIKMVWNSKLGVVICIYMMYVQAYMVHILVYIVHRVGWLHVGHTITSVFKYV